MSTLTRLVIKPGLLLLLALFLYLISAAWIKADKIWQWKLALLAQEFGHWFALAALIVVLVGWRVFTGWHRYAIGLLGLTCAITLMIPAIGAARLTPGFQWARLWMPWLKSHAEVITEHQEFWREGNEALDLIVYRPVVKAPPRPWLLVLHSGGWDGGTADEFADWHQEMAAAHGVVVLAMNYRLAPQHPWPAQREDVQHAVAWARAHASELGIDPARLILMGRSAGGQIASACAYGVPELKPIGCVLFYSPMDMNFARRYAFAEDILNSLKLLRQYLGGDPEQAPEAYRTASAVNFVSPAVPPTLMIHGTRDSLVWVEQSRRLTQRLKDAGVDHQYIELPWATHGCDYFPSTPEGQLSMHAAVAFIERLK